MFVEDFPVELPLWPIAFVALFIMCICFVKFLLMPAQRTWYHSYSIGAGVNFLEIIAMQFRGSNVSLILEVKVAYQENGNHQTLRDLEDFYLANRTKVTDAKTFMAMYDQDQKGID